jgi:hypothetical protein
MTNRPSDDSQSGVLGSGRGRRRFESFSEHADLTAAGVRRLSVPAIAAVAITPVERIAELRARDPEALGKLSPYLEG